MFYKAQSVAWYACVLPKYIAICAHSYDRAVERQRQDCWSEPAWIVHWDMQGGQQSLLATPVRPWRFM